MMKTSTRSLLVGGVALLAAVGIYLARHVLVPFLVAGVIAYTLDPLVAILERRGVRRGLGALLVMAALILILLGVAYATIPEMISQVRLFVDRLPGYLQAVKATFDPSIAWLEQRYPEQVALVETQTAEAVRGLMPAVAGGAVILLKDALTNTPRIMIWLLTIVVVPVFAYYLIVDYQEIHGTLETLIPRQHRPGVQRYVEEIDRVLRAWLKGQLTVASVLAIIYAVGLTLLGVPLGLLIGLVGGLSHIVPYMGLITGFIPAAVLSFLDSGKWTAPVMVAGVFLFGQLLETTVISPRIVGKGLGLPPAVVLLAVFVGGELFGFAGLLLALPATAAGLVMLRDLRRSFEPSGARFVVTTPKRSATRRRRPRP